MGWGWHERRQVWFEREQGWLLQQHSSSGILQLSGSQRVVECSLCLCNVKTQVVLEWIDHWDDGGAASVHGADICAAEYLCSQKR